VRACSLIWGFMQQLQEVLEGQGKIGSQLRHFPVCIMCLCYGRDGLDRSKQETGTDTN
jgi:hypothetical protein